MTYLTEKHPLSIRRACAAIGLSRSAWYRPLVDWLERDRPIADALDALAEQKPGLGFWKLYRRVRRQGYAWNRKRVYRVYCLLNLRRRPKKRMPSRDPMPLLVPQKPNEALKIEIDTSLGVLRQAARDSGFIELPVTAEHAEALMSLPPLHKDPFDRLLLTQAIVEPMKLITADEQLGQYSELVWKIQ